MRARRQSPRCRCLRGSPFDLPGSSDVFSSARPFSGVRARGPAPMDATELLRRYAAEERSFPGVILVEAKLRLASLTGIDLRDANLAGADFSRTKLARANLS